MKDPGALPDELSVYMAEHLIGILHRSTPLSFIYDEKWLAPSLAQVKKSWHSGSNKRSEASPERHATAC